MFHILSCCLKSSAQIILKIFNGFINKVLQETLEKIGCTTPFGFKFEKICNEKNKSMQALALYKALFRETLQLKECPYPCQYLRNWLMPWPGALKKNHTMRLRFNKYYIKVIKSSYAYTELELFAELGGYVGLFLGLSVFDLCILIPKIFERAMLHRL